MWQSGFRALLALTSVSIFLVATAARSQSLERDDDPITLDRSAIQAIWMVQNVPFEFRGDTIGYTCDTFKKKVRAILIAVGVHTSMIVEARCPPARLEPTMPTRRQSLFRGEVDNVVSNSGMTARTSSRISASISFAAPALATDENIRLTTTFDAQERLVAQVKGEELPTASNIPVFPAIWAPIELTSRSDPWLQPNDCELLRQLSAQVFQKIAVEPLEKLRCQASMPSRLSLDVKALLPMR